MLRENAGSCAKYPKGIPQRLKPTFILLHYAGAQVPTYPNSRALAMRASPMARIASFCVIGTLTRHEKTS